MLLARSIMAGVELGIFESLEAAPLDVAEIAARCGTDQKATSMLLEALSASGYLKLRRTRFALSAQSRKWLLRNSPNTVRDKLLFQAHEWIWLEHLENFIRTSHPLDFHSTMTKDQRSLYHRSMRVIAGIASREIAWRTPVPPGARRMLDLGGSHGHFAASICRRHPNLTAEVMDFPEAIAEAAPILAVEGLKDRVVHVAGDVTTTALGESLYDLIFMSNLAHHLDQDQNESLARRAARALRPGGVFVLQEPIRPETPHKAGQTGTLLALYFALQSRSGVRGWSLNDLQCWQREAGLVARAPISLVTAPGWVQQAAVKPGHPAPENLLPIRELRSH